MPIFPQGAINTTALVTPDLYIQIVPPTIYLLNGVPTNIVGYVGVASWGPVNVPTDVSAHADATRLFGSMRNRTNDLVSAIWLAAQQGSAAVYKCIRVTDGTDAAATATAVGGANGLTVSAKYTGVEGNGIQITLAAGTAANTWKAIVTMPNQNAEIFDNIAGSANALWLAIASAINNGNDPLRGPSQLVVASAGSSVDAPTAGTTSLAGGTDGVATLTSSTFIGQDTVPRKGMYALRGTGASIGCLIDVTDQAVASTQIAFGLNEGVYMISTTAPGDTISNAISTKSTNGIDSYAYKLFLGDWLYVNDTVNNVRRLMSPATLVAGMLGNMAPHWSSLNKPVQGIIGTQRSMSGIPYSSADIQSLAQAGIDLIMNPIPAGKVFGVRIGRNTSSNAVIHGDNYTRMTNYIAATLNAGMGVFIGMLQSPDVRSMAKTTIDSMLMNLWSQGLIGNADGTIPFVTKLDSNNNPPTRVALGYMQADVKVQYLSVIEYFIINLEGGQSVQVKRADVNPSLIASS